MVGELARQGARWLGDEGELDLGDGEGDAEVERVDGAMRRGEGESTTEDGAGFRSVEDGPERGVELPAGARVTAGGGGGGWASGWEGGGWDIDTVPRDVENGLIKLCK